VNQKQQQETEEVLFWQQCYLPIHEQNVCIGVTQPNFEGFVRADLIQERLITFN
jgi:hypothetical protein